MKNRSVIAGLIGVVGMTLTLAIGDLHAQRGQGAGHGKPPTTVPGKADPGTGKPSGAGKPSGTTAPTPHGKPTVGDLLTQNTALASTVQALLPAGTDLQAASASFRNLGQFVAAAHVSHNLDIPFDQLKANVTGPNSESLGKAIKDLKPSADANAEKKKAEKSARADIKASRNPKATS